MIHTVADYAELDAGRRWFFAYELGAEELILRPTGAHSDQQIIAMAAFLRGPHRDRFRLAFGEDTFIPDLESPGAIFVGHDETYMERAFLRLRPDVAFPESVARRGYAYYDRDTKTAYLAAALDVARDPDAEGREGLQAFLTAKIFNLGLRADLGSAETITRDDVDGMDLRVLNAGRAADPFRMIVAVLRLANLDRLVGTGGGYHTPDSLRGKLAEFPVIFWQRPGGEPFYVGDGSWCAGYRLGLETGKAVENLGPMERFVLDAAYDLDGDESPDVFVVNEVIAYYLTEDDEVLVIDWQWGC